MGVRPREDHLHVLGGPPHLEQVRLDPVSSPIGFAGDLFLRRQHCLGLAKVHQVIAALLPEDNAVDQIARAGGVLALDRFPFSLSHFLTNHLLGCLGRDAPQFIHLDHGADLVAHLRFAIHAARFLDRDL